MAMPRLTSSSSSSGTGQFVETRQHTVNFPTPSAMVWFWYWTTSIVSHTHAGILFLQMKTKLTETKTLTKIINLVFEWLYHLFQERCRTTNNNLVYFKNCTMIIILFQHSYYDYYTIIIALKLWKSDIMRLTIFINLIVQIFNDWQIVRSDCVP